MRAFPDTMGRWVGMLILAALLATIGCGDRSKASVSGTVSYKGQNLKGGRVTFVNDKKESFVSEIEEDGKYSILKVPPGNYKVCVETDFLKPSPEMAMMAKNRPADAGEDVPDFAAQAKRYVAIPDKYGDLDQTPLKYTVQGGKQEHDIKLD